MRKVEVFRQAYRAVGLGWLLAPTEWPELRWVFDLLYALFARFRVRIGRLFGRRCGSGSCNTTSTVNTLTGLLYVSGVFAIVLGILLMGVFDRFASEWVSSSAGSLAATAIAGFWLVRAGTQFYLGRRRGDWLVVGWFALLGALHLVAAMALAGAQASNDKPKAPATATLPKDQLFRNQKSEHDSFEVGQHLIQLLATSTNKWETGFVSRFVGRPVAFIGSGPPFAGENSRPKMKPHFDKLREKVGSTIGSPIKAGESRQESAGLLFTDLMLSSDVLLQIDFRPLASMKTPGGISWMVRVNGIVTGIDPTNRIVHIRATPEDWKMERVR